MPIEKYDTLADYYGTSVDYLIGRTDQAKPYPESIIKTPSMKYNKNKKTTN